MFMMINILFGSPHTCCTMLLAHKWGTEGKWLCCNPHNHSHADHCCACISTHGFACSCTFWHVWFFLRYCKICSNILRFFGVPNSCFLYFPLRPSRCSVLLRFFEIIFGYFEIWHVLKCFSFFAFFANSIS